MFHKNVSNSIRSFSSAAPIVSSAQGFDVEQSPAAPPRLTLVPSGGGGFPLKRSKALFDLIAIAAHRCSSFFAEAAVLVLVLALLDRFMLKGRMELGWAVSALTISLALLGASIATDFSARRWLQRS